MRMLTLLLYIAFIYIIVYALPLAETLLGVPTEFTLLIDKVVATFVIVISAFVFLAIIEGWVRSHFKLSEDEARYISSIIRYILGGLALLFIGFLFIGDTTSLTLFSGLVGAGLAITLQPTMLNIIGWIAIVVSKLYKIGDRVFVGDSIWGALGDISDINLFFTRINELDRNSWQETGGFVSLPNRIVLEKSVVNYTAESPFIWDETSFRISHGSDYELAKKIAENAVNVVVGEKMKDAAKFLASRKYKLKIRDIKEEPITYLSMEGGAVRVAVRYLVSARKKRQAEARITEKILEGIGKNRKRIEVVG